MIDYDKLKIAIELVEKIHLGKFHMALSTHDGVEYRFYVPINESLFTTCLDELIEYLKELTKPEPKYKVGDRVYFADGQQDIIEKIVREYCGETIIATDGWTLRSEACHPTRQALIEAQLKHWSKLYEEANPNTLCLIKNTKPKLTTTDIINSAFKQLFPCPEEPNHLWVRGKCYDCGIEKLEHFNDAVRYLHPDIKVNQSQVDADGCQHKEIVTGAYSRSNPPMKCIICGELYR